MTHSKSETNTNTAYADTPETAAQPPQPLQAEQHQQTKQASQPEQALQAEPASQTGQVSQPEKASQPEQALQAEQTSQSNQPSQASHKFRWSRLSYRARVTLSFALIAAMTAIVAIVVVSFVWEQHFQRYTFDNMQEIAQITADQVGERYEQQGFFSPETLQPALFTLSANKGIGLQVLDANGTVLLDSTVSTNGENNVGPSLAPQAQPGNMVQAAIFANDTAVGSVRVWVYGSNRLLRASDEEFRDRSYEAMIASSLIAIVLATLIGYLFARNLVRPIRRISRTAVAVKEGDLSARTGMQGEDEVSRLGQTFDAMAASIERDRKLERRLTTDVAHELRTPLMAIQATVEAMVDGVFPVDEEHLETVNSEVQRLSRLVDSQLKLSRLENRANTNKQEVMDTGRVVSDIVSTHEAYVREAGLQLHFHATPNVLIQGDPDLIRQATANLISNAVRYTPEGGHITVSVDKDETTARIAVKDTGIGLTDEEAQMVFSRFWRAGSARDRASGGLGIGLTVVKEIVDRHEGHIEVQGTPNKGACFTLVIPLYEARETRRGLQERIARATGPIESRH